MRRICGAFATQILTLDPVHDRPVREEPRGIVVENHAYCPGG